MLRRLFLTLATSTAALAAAGSGAGTAVAAGPALASSVASAPARLAPLPLPPLREQEWPAVQGKPAGPPQTQKRDSLTVTVTDPDASTTRTAYELKCGPTGGTHPRAQAACDRLTELAAGAHDPFAQVPRDSACTMQYGGPATAHVTGTWRGRAVDAAFNRGNGCEISRWNNLQPVLPGPSA